MEEISGFVLIKKNAKKIHFSRNKKKTKSKYPKFILFILCLLIILLISSSIIIYMLLERLNNISNNSNNNMNNINKNNNMNNPNNYINKNNNNYNITIQSHSNIEEKLNLSFKFFEIYSVLFETMRNPPKPSSGITNHNYNIKENKGIGICSICKNENLYLKEYATYYQKLGIKKIIIYDNNDIDGEKPEEVLQNFIKTNFVEIIDIRGFRSAQLPSYNHCYEKYRNQFDYISFLDIDEFIVIQSNKSINDYLYDVKFDKCESILLNWVMYGDSDLLKYDNRTMIERFTKPVEKWNRGKSIVRTNIDNLIIISTIIVGVNVNYFCDSNGNKIIPNRNYLDFTAPKEPESYIKHFYTKTAEEFCNKIKNGDAHFNKNHPKSKIILQNRIQNFMKFNKMTREKRDIIRNCSGVRIF